ncbi:MAG: VOC family protein [Verrucomicrobiota bacterium]
MSIGIKELAYVAYPVTDLERSRRFYGDVLGLKEEVTFDHQGTVGWVEYEVDGRTFALAQATKEWQPSESGAGAAFEVESIESALEVLAAAGTEPATPIGDFSACRICVIPDPDGNGIILHQRKPHHPDFST